MHPLLNRQYHKRFKDTQPLGPELEGFLSDISTTYENYDSDRALMERSFDISSKEFTELQAKILKLLDDLKLEKASVEQKIIERTAELKNKIDELDTSNELLVTKEKELILANNRLLELDKIKTEFISVAAHQLRTPLSAIKWSLSLIIDDKSEGMTTEQRRLLMKGYESNQRAINLINKMLVVTRIESGKMAYDLQPIHIEYIIETTMLDFDGYVATHKMNLIFERATTKIPYVKADAEKIRSVIQNLIENALFYSIDGGIVRIKTEIEGAVLKVSIKDSGIGIPASQQLAIFNKFYRAENASKVRTDGSGLGLFVAKNIVENHGGTIGFDSTEGVGTTFYFTLPIQPNEQTITST